MRIHANLLLLLIVVICAAGCAGDNIYVYADFYKTPYAAQIKTVAVVDFAGEGGQAIADILTMNLFLAGYEVVERDHLKSLVTEKKLSKTGFKDLSDVEKAKSLGKILNADAIITGELIKVKYPRYTKVGRNQLKYDTALLDLSARAIDTRTGKVFWTCVINTTSSAETGKRLLVMDFINEPCAELVYNLKSANYPTTAKTYKGAELDARRAERGF